MHRHHRRLASVGLLLLGSFMLISMAVGAGEYAYRETDLRTVYLDANENYWLGVTDVPEVILSKAE